MIVCDNCGMSEAETYRIHVIPELQNPVDSANAGESAHLCHQCCVDTDNLAPGYGWSRNIRGADKIMIEESSIGVPYLDPAFETYHCM